MDSARRDSAEQGQPSPIQLPNNDGPDDIKTSNRPSSELTPARNSNAQSSEGQQSQQHQQPSERVDPYVEQVRAVTTSDIGITVLLGRLKQSLQSAREFASFLQKRARLEEEHANGLRKISRVTHDNLRRPEHRQGSFIASYDEITRTHERMADNGLSFASSLHQMYEDMLELTSNIESGRKHWKHTGLAAEQRLMDTEAAMRKSKAKYDALAEDYDRARTGGGQTKKFGLKGPKSAAQHEEELLRKVQQADQDYAAKVQTAQVTRHEHLSRARPEAVKSLQDMIKECDSALTLQMQRFASFSEKLLLENGMSISPLKGGPADQSRGRSMREAIADINNDGDLSYYIASHTSQIAPRTEIRYEKNPVLAPPAAAPVRAQPERQPDAPVNVGSFNQRQGPGGGPSAVPPNQPPMGSGPNYNQGHPALQQQPPFQQHERSYSQGPHNVPPQPYGNQGAMGGPGNGNMRAHTPSASYSAGGPPQLGSLPFQTSAPLSAPFQTDGPPPVQEPFQSGTPPLQQQQHGQQYNGPPQPYAQRADPANLPPLKPVFGVTLDALFERDGSAVPMVVYQCIQAVDLFGLEVEGIYRLSGTGSHVNKIRAMFDNDASKLDFRNPEAFFHDVNSVAGLLKQFFRDLPDPLLTSEHYSAFIEASKAEDDTVRRDSLHAIINALPDPNYATLRAITLHLHRVVMNANINRMNASNLAIVWGPTLMGANTGGKIQDAGWQVKVVQTILENCYQIFDDD